MLHRHLTIPIKLAVAALLVVFASGAQAEWKQVHNAQGNNVGLTVGLNSGGPISSTYYGLPPHQFPRGSGNFYRVGRWGWGVNVARDGDGDGAAEDTLANLSRAGYFNGQLNALEAMDVLSALAAAGEDMGDAASRIDVNRVYVSNDPDDQAEWPAWAREGRSPSGEPIWHGAETVAAAHGDCFSSGGANMGASIEHQFYFLNFAESNNMVYCRVFIRNMSEYNKWNPNPDHIAKIQGTLETGQVWMGAQLTYSMANDFLIGGQEAAWAYYFPREIILRPDPNGTEGSFTGHPAMVAYMMLKRPEFKGQDIKFTNTLAHGWTSEYGNVTPEEVLEGGYPMPRAYRYGNGRYDPTAPFYPEWTNPWTGSPLYGWPGVPLPDEDRYDQWWWGTNNTDNSYNFWGEFQDVAPRDSFSLDAVIAWLQPANPPFAMPPSDLPNLDNQEVQDQFSTALRYMDIAETVYSGNFVLPETPEPPPLTIVPGDKQVTITWSDVNLNTPDAYYYFLQEHPELDPSGNYREYDFEGYRLYRSFVGPSDSHSELIWEGSQSGGDLQFFYVDTKDKDIPRHRMNNGMRVWYALVPYDRNWDPSEQEWFSLPDPSSGKVWNRPGSGLYTVQPRSNATNFKAAELGGYAYNSPTGATATVSPTIFVTLTGDGSRLSEAPVLLEPQMDLTLTPILNERITTELQLGLLCTDWGPNGFRAGRRYIALTNSSGSIIDESAPFIVVNSGGDKGRLPVRYHYGVDDDGATLAIDASFISTRGGQGGNFHTQIDLGGYTGADVNYRTEAWSGMSNAGLEWTGNRSLFTFVKAGQFTIEFSSGSGGVTATVTDNTRGETIPFSPYVEEGWGFVPPGMGEWDLQADYGNGWGGTGRTETPQSERDLMLVESLPADNTEDFSLWVNGQYWRFTNVSSMPSGTMTVTSAWGSWNGDGTFNQYPDPVHPGDSWTITVNPMSMDPNDADLTKIRVVPNPYMASSFLDLSPSQRRIEFVNLPARCTIRIYSLGGHLVNVLNHIGADRYGWGDYEDIDRLDAFGEPRKYEGYDNHRGTEAWNLRNRFGQTVASGLYFFHVTDERGEDYTGKFYVVN